MPSTTLFDRTGKAVGTVELATSCSRRPSTRPCSTRWSPPSWPAAGSGTHDTKTRGEVRGGGKKPYRQKGTGRARQGTRTAPHYRGGGVVFGPHPRSYEQRLPRKMKRLALRGALTAKFGDEAISVIDSFGLERSGPRTLVGVLGALDADRPGPRGGAVARRAARAVGPQPADRRGHPRRLAQRRRRAQGGHASLIEQPALARMEEVYA